MSTATAVREHFRPEIGSLLEREEPVFLRALRQRAWQRFKECGLPTRRMEEWRFTPLAVVADSSWTTAASVPARVVLDTSDLPDGLRMVFVDGHYLPSLSVVDGLPDGVEVMDLQSAIVAEPQLVEEYLGRLAGVDEGSFVALNSALMQNGAMIRLRPGATVAEAIHLVFVSTADGGPTVAYPRNLLIAGEQSSAVVVETHIVNHAESLSCVVTEAQLDAGARLSLTRVQEEAPNGAQITATHVRLGRDADFTSRTVSEGGALVRNDLVVEHAGEGSHCRLDGLAITRDRQLVDNHLRVVHEVPHCHSEQLYKGVLDQRSRVVFNGCVVVAEGAQKTDARQSNRNLLLSDHARVHSNPQLEIFADDVRCTHGSAIGRLDEEAIFYLRSRGISRAEAEHILIRAFADEVVSLIDDPWSSARLQKTLGKRLPVTESFAGIL